jgi:hypothetical protein
MECTEKLLISACGACDNNMLGYPSWKAASK